MSDTAELTAEGGELNVQAIDEGPGHDDSAGEQAAELEKLKARMAELQAQLPGGSNTPLAAPKADSKPEGASGGESTEEQAAKEEADGRSVYVGNVDYECTPEELQLHFQSCGTVNRVTILTDKFGSPKGFAYIEFLEADAVQAACLLADSELRGRPLKVSPKRTNVPGMKARGRGRFSSPWRGGRGYGRRGGYYDYPSYRGYGRRGRRGGYYPY